MGDWAPSSCQWHSADLPQSPEGCPPIPVLVAEVADRSLVTRQPSRPSRPPPSLDFDQKRYAALPEDEEIGCIESARPHCGDPERLEAASEIRENEFVNVVVA